jgi:hypothetical protein
MLVTVSLGWALLQTGRFLLSPLLPTIITDLGITEATAGIALAITVVLTLGFPAGDPRLPGFALISTGLLYAGFCLVPTGLATVAARQRGIRTAAVLALAPVGQVIIAATIVFAR